MNDGCDWYNEKSDRSAGGQICYYFSQLIVYLFVVPYTVRSTINTAIQLLLYSLNKQNFATETFGKGLDPSVSGSVHIENIIDIWLPIYVQPEPIDLGLMFSYWSGECLVLVITPDEILYEIFPE